MDDPSATNSADQFLLANPELLLDLLRQNMKMQNELRHQLQAQTEQIKILTQTIEQLRKQLDRTSQQHEDEVRAAHRQAAPFRIEERQRKSAPKKPGRPPGHPGACRTRPEQIDETIDVPLEHCPKCGGPVHDVETIEQFIEELPPVRPRVSRLLTRRGCCPACGDVASTHPLQTSTASGAAGVQLGPRAQAVALELNRAQGLTTRKTCRTLERLFGLKLSPGGLIQVGHRLAGRLGEWMGGLREQARAADVMHADETGWWLGGQGCQLWVFTNPGLTLYQVRDSRGRSVLHDVLGDNFPGVLVSDCLATYDDASPVQQKCYSHHLKAVAKAIAAQGGGGAGFLQDIKNLLKSAMLYKKMKPELSAEAWAEIRAGLVCRAERLLAPARAAPLEQAVANRLRKQQDHLFTFLDYEAVEATNNLAERQLRPAVISRKLSAGNKTARGARTWETLASLAATCAQRGESFLHQIASSAVLVKPSVSR